MAKPLKLEGYISPVGKLVVPAKTMYLLDLKANSTRFQIGTDRGKRKIKSLYLVPTQDAQTESFAFVKAAKRYTIDLGLHSSKRRH